MLVLRSAERAARGFSPATRLASSSSFWALATRHFSRRLGRQHACLRLTTRGPAPPAQGTVKTAAIWRARA
jgi:hypothetical protein